MPSRSAVKSGYRPRFVEVHGGAEGEADLRAVLESRRERIEVDHGRKIAYDIEGERCVGRICRVIATVGDGAVGATDCIAAGLSGGTVSVFQAGVSVTCDQLVDAAADGCRQDRSR